MNARAPIDPSPEEQLVPADLKLLLSGYNLLDIMVDLYGDVDEDGSVDICAVTLVGDKRDIWLLVPHFAKCSMQAACERAIEQRKRESKEQNRLERAMFDLAMSMPP